jgi:hypothetical protein
VVDGHRIWRTATATASVPGRRSWQTAIGSGGGGSVLADCHERRRAAARPGGWPSIPAGSCRPRRAATGPGGPPPPDSHWFWRSAARPGDLPSEPGDLSPDPAVCPDPAGRRPSRWGFWMSGARWVTRPSRPAARSTGG